MLILLWWHIWLQKLNLSIFRLCWVNTEVFQLVKQAPVSSIILNQEKEKKPFKNHILITCILPCEGKDLGLQCSWSACQWALLTKTKNFHHVKKLSSVFYILCHFLHRSHSREEVMVKGIPTVLPFFFCCCGTRNRIFSGHTEKGSWETSLGTLQSKPNMSSLLRASTHIVWWSVGVGVGFMLKVMGKKTCWLE